MRKLLIALFAFASFTLSAEQVNLRTAGASADGKRSNTQLIQQTIDRLTKAGGGTLYFPAGTYLTGPIRMKSNITLYLENGATLRFSDKFDEYLPFVEMRYEGVVMKSFHPLIYAVDAENLAIRGDGTLDGQGKAWWMEFFNVLIDLRDNGVRLVNKYQPLWDEANKDAKLEEETNEDYAMVLKRRFFRPPFIQPIRCKNITIEGVKIINSPFWTVNPEFCENITIQGVTVINPPSPNTDGINPSSCRNVRIADCHISVGDDCITLKSGRDGQGRRYNVPCENITITNCTMLSGHGGVVIGSEMSGGVKRVSISNCVFDGTDRGIRLKSTRGRGGAVEDITVSNVMMHNIKKEAIVMDLYYSKMPVEPLSDRTPWFRNIHINGLIGVNVNTPILIRGLEEAPVTDVSLTNIRLTSTQKPLFENYRNLRLNEVYINNQLIQIDSKP